MSHTKEPWVWHAQGDADEYCLLAADNRWVIAFRQNGELHTVEQEANARRIVACVNALSGIPTEDIEQGQVLHNIGGLYKQRDELLAALKDVGQILTAANEIPGGPISDTIWYSKYETLFDYIDAAIAKAES